MRDILMIIPSRSSNGKRIASLQRLIQSWRKTTNGSSDLLLVLDHDDAHHYFGGWIPPMVGVTIIPRMKLAPKLNYVIEGFVTVGGYKTIGFVGDDVVFQTEDWEAEIVKWHDSNVGISYCNDLLQGETLPNNVFISAEIVQALGFMVPRELQHYYIDNFWKDLGIRLGKLKYFPDTIIEHMHWSNSKSEKDELYTESEKMMGQDQQAFDKYRELAMAADVQKIKNYDSRRTKSPSERGT
jgi:hypothetical protein